MLFNNSVWNHLLRQYSSFWRPFSRKRNNTCSMICRHLHSKNEKTVHGHKISKKFEQSVCWLERYQQNYDQKHSWYNKPRRKNWRLFICEEIHSLNESLHCLLTQRCLLILEIGNRSEHLATDASKYEKRAIQLVRLYWWRTYGPLVIGATILLLLIIFRFWWF